MAYFAQMRKSLLNQRVKWVSSEEVTVSSKPWKARCIGCVWAWADSAESYGTPLIPYAMQASRLCIAQ